MGSGNPVVRELVKLLDLASAGKAFVGTQPWG